MMVATIIPCLCKRGNHTPVCLCTHIIRSIIDRVVGVGARWSFVRCNRAAEENRNTTQQTSKLEFEERVPDGGATAAAAATAAAFLTKYDPQIPRYSPALPERAPLGSSRPAISSAIHRCAVVYDLCNGAVALMRSVRRADGPGAR